MDNATIIASTRFGMGRRPDDAVPSDPRAWLHAQLQAPDPTPLQGAVDTATALGVVHDRFQSQFARKQAMQLEAAAQPAVARPGMEKPGSAGAQADAVQNETKSPNPIYRLAKQEAHGLLGNALVTTAPFRERLVWFWANHFTIVARTPVSAACSGAYVREAIRPYVTGRFVDMLLAVMRHPAMIAYLNQDHSVGPDSMAGQRRHLGLNENLARESLELHTVTPAAGYTQQDVTNYARILTGWTVEMHDEPRGFQFRPNMHEPGEIEVMGRTWPAGEQGGVALLQWLGTHPATYRHLADKLVRHFAADEPQPADIRQHRGGAARHPRRPCGGIGRAGGAAQRVGAGDQAAHAAGLRGRVPARAGRPRRTAVPNLPQMTASLGQGMFQAPLPNGWPDRAGRLDRAAGDARTGGLRLWPVRPGGVAGPRGAGPCRAWPDADSGHARPDTRRRLAARRADPAAVLSRVPEALKMNRDLCPDSAMQDGRPAASP